MLQKLRVMDHTGDTTREFDTADPVAKEAANALFDEVLKGANKAWKKQPDGTPATQLRKYDPDAGEILVIRPLQGG